MNVPSRSTHAASGSTSGARVLVPFSLVPVKISVSRRSSAWPVAAVGHALPGRSCWITHSTFSAPARARARMLSVSAANPTASAPRVLGARSARSRKSSSAPAVPGGTPKAS